ncbi:hypothetical protein GQX74_011096 [Glossina fuscipes]|nr:hypothetical protein GQX74_011096 [Glossina fuscipes]
MESRINAEMDSKSTNSGNDAITIDNPNDIQKELVQHTYQIPEKSRIILHAFAHNPTDVHPNKGQWYEILNDPEFYGIWLKDVKLMFSWNYITNLIDFLAQLQERQQ